VIAAVIGIANRSNDPELSIAAICTETYDLGCMEMIDRAEEWRRLKETYLQMSDEELEAVAEDGYELTDVAQQALTGEIARRGLKLELKKAPEPQPEPTGNSAPDPDELELTPVYTAWDRAEAIKVMTALNDSGIPAFLGPDNVESSDEFNGNFDRGIKIKTRYIDSQRAFGVIAHTLPPEESTQEEEPVHYARCPKCHSDEIVLIGLEENGPDDPDARFNWSCDACGHQWKDDGVEKET